MQILWETLASRFFMPHGHCYLWNPLMVGLQVGTNAVIGVAYVAISAMLATLVYQLRDLPFKIVYAAFGAFIVSCGVTHFMDVLVIWRPMYWLDVAIRVVTAAASMGTAVMLPALLPRAHKLMAGARAAHQRGVALESAVADLEAMYQRSRQIDQLKSDFVAKVTHDLRTPLTLILTPVQRLLAEERLAPGQRDDLVVVQENAGLLLARVDDLLDAAKLESGVMPLRYQAFDLAAMLRRRLHQFTALARERATCLVLDAPDQLAVELDANQTSRVVVNLLANAFHHTPPGGQIVLTLREQDQAKVAISVADSGPGVPPALRRQVFDRFVQGEGARGGSGLGLSIVRDFAELHGGEVSCDGSDLGGALFTVRLPSRAPAGHAVLVGEAGDDAPEREPAMAPIRPEAAPDAAGVVADAADGRARVVVAEDNVDLNRLLCSLLARDYHVVPAPDGVQALARLADAPCDLVVSDLEMPRLGGEGLLHAMRQQANTADVPVLLVTAQAAPARRAQLLKAGAQDYLVKPFDPAELRVRAGHLVAIKRARDALTRQVVWQGASLDEMARRVRNQADDLAKAAARAEAAQAEATRHSADKSDFLHLIAHELNTPLTAIRLQVDRLTRMAPDLAERPRRSCLLLARSTHRLGELVASLMQWGRLMDQRAPAPAPADVPLAPLLAELLRAWEDQATGSGVALHGEVEPNGLVAAADPSLLRTALSNLVGNALKFTPRGGRVTVICRPSPLGIAVEVVDTGVGIDLKHQRTIFDPFVFLESVRNKHTPGLGLGLPLVRSIAQALGGEVSVRSSAGVGTAFTLSVPAAPSTPAVPAGA